MSGNQQRAAVVLAEVEQYVDVRLRQSILTAALDAVAQRQVNPDDPDDTVFWLHRPTHRVALRLTDGTLTLLDLVRYGAGSSGSTPTPDTWLSPRPDWKPRDRPSWPCHDT